jgi:hypothetical protein
MNTSLPWQTQRAIRESMGFSAIVDINGVHNPKTGGFHLAQDAVEAGHKSIFVRNGTYPGMTFTSAKKGTDFTIVGESIAGVIIDGESTRSSVFMSTGATRNRIERMTLRTTSGAGVYWGGVFDSGAGYNQYVDLHCDECDYHAFFLNTSTSTNNLLLRCRATEDNGTQDGSGFYINCHKCQIINCFAEGCGVDGFNGLAPGDDMLWLGNHARDNAGTGLIINSGADNHVIVGNRCTNNTSAELADNSGTGTSSGNDTT